MITPIDWKKGNGLVPAIVQDADTGRVLMLAYMNEESCKATEDSGLVTFFSRSRQSLWTKGETSGHTLKFVAMSVDCDGDTLLVRARPTGPVCHLGTATCFEQEDVGIDFLSTLVQVIDSRFAPGAPKDSYVAKLAASGLDRIAQKVGEESVETIIAAKNSDLALFEGEAADLLFHLLVLLKERGSSLNAIVARLQSRHK